MDVPPELRELEQLLQQPVVSVTGVPIVTSASLSPRGQPRLPPR